MKKYMFLLQFILFLAFSCEKPEPEQNIKYLSKILSADSSTIVESYTWDSNKRLITYNSAINYTLSELNFHYDSIGYIYKIEYCDYEYNLGYYLLFWNNEKELDSIIEFTTGYNNDKESVYPILKYSYSYNNKHECIRIEKKFLQDVGINYDIDYNIIWEENNIKKFYANSTSFVAGINNIKYDKKHNARIAFPKIILFHIKSIVYNPSNNNSLQNYYYDVNNGDSYINFEYDYIDDYPVRQYRLSENGERKLLYYFIYE
ncbi:hypothetical protein LJC30_00925 [Odoribacter sp. OttesenSCG-928-L07]|nr:hypothetical protein [Odoribacter sp. OttesenSCG-928-L07]MDL2238980.1 hypothetical protein [Bacteroidales bacterium OttesenSCG-928-L14]MDL2240867.1 hypothetical protein [Bacteroidales bacterium OttesenSCG-928-K22]